MASIRHALLHQNSRQNQENVTAQMPGKTVLGNSKPLQPTRRAALDDLGNRLANKVSQNGATQKTNIIMGPPMDVPGKKVDLPKKNVAINKENSNVIKKDSKPVDAKKVVRQESILSIHTNRAAVLRQEASKLTTNTKINATVKETKEISKLLASKTQNKVSEKVDSKLLQEKCKDMTIIDPDENSRKDPQMVTEYIEDILSYVRELELTYPIQEKFLNDSKVTPKMRSTLVNWLVDVHKNFSFELETLHLCISICDRYLMVNKKVDKSIFQLVGTSALLLASKYEELYTPELSDYVYICDGAFTKKQILQMEIDILRKLEFRMGWPMSINFLRRYSKIAQARSDQHTLAKYILELALLEYGVAHIRPSIQAAAACCLSIAILTEVMDPSKLWTPTMVHYTTYKYSEVETTLNNFARLLKRAETCKFDAIREKYSHAKFGKISLNFKLQGPLMRKLTSPNSCTF